MNYEKNVCTKFIFLLVDGPKCTLSYVHDFDFYGFRYANTTLWNFECSLTAYERIGGVLVNITWKIMIQYIQQCAKSMIITCAYRVFDQNIHLCGAKNRLRHDSSNMWPRYGPMTWAADLLAYPWPHRSGNYRVYN